MLSLGACLPPKSLHTSSETRTTHVKKKSSRCLKFNKRIVITVCRRKDANSRCSDACGVETHKKGRDL